MSASSKSTTSSTPPKTPKIQLPGNGFSIWTRPKPTRPPATLRLPGRSFSIWTKPSVTEAAPVPVAQAKPSIFQTETYQPTKPEPILVSTIKSSGLWKWAALLLFPLFLFAYLSSQSQVETLAKEKSKEEDKANQAAERERKANDLAEKYKTDARKEIEALQADKEAMGAQMAGLNEKATALAGQFETLQKEKGDLNQKATALAGQLSDANDKATVLANQKELMQREKDGVERTLKTQLANQEMAYNNLRGEFDKLKKDSESIKQQFDGMNQKLQAAEAAAKEKAEAFAKEMANLTDSRADLEKALGQARLDLEHAKSSMASNETLVAELRRKIEELTKALEAKR